MFCISPKTVQIRLKITNVNFWFWGSILRKSVSNSWPQFIYIRSLAKRPLRGLLALRALVSSWFRPDFETYHLYIFKFSTFWIFEFSDFFQFFFDIPIFYDANQFLSLPRWCTQSFMQIRQGKPKLQGGDRQTDRHGFLFGQIPFH